MLGATAQAVEASANASDSTMTNRRRPLASLIGPLTNCPAANPRMNAVKGELNQGGGGTERLLHLWQGR